MGSELLWGVPGPNQKQPGHLAFFSKKNSIYVNLSGDTEVGQRPCVNDFMLSKGCALAYAIDPVQD